MKTPGDSLSVPQTNHGLPPRVDTLHNVTITGRSGARLIAPDPEVMATLEAESGGKVRHFPTDMAALDQEAPPLGEAGFSNCVVRPLTERLIAEFPGKQLALRAVGVSINGHQSESEGVYDLRDVTETVNMGTEKPGEVFNVQNLEPETPEPTTTHQIAHYASTFGAVRALEMPEEMADAAFPAILVYDRSGLQAANGHYGVSFREGHDPSQVLLAAYVVDSPIS